MYEVAAFVVSLTTCAISGANFVVTLSARANVSPVFGWVAVAIAWLISVSVTIVVGYFYDAN